jgi:hypothetical protein
MMYHKTVALNRTLHADLTISPSPNRFRFAADLLTVMLATSEFYDASRQYPIVFTISPENVFSVSRYWAFRRGKIFLSIRMASGMDGIFLPICGVIHS